MPIPRCVRAIPLLAALTLGSPTADAAGNPEAIRINNRGVAQMGQQLTERAAASFEDALRRDPGLAQAAVNRGIALLALERIEEAKTALRQAIALEPRSPQAWYNLGLAQHANNETEAALASFEQAVRLDPADADSYYFLASTYGELRQFDREIEVLHRALAIQPLHASAEFALARALDRTGRTEEARQHFNRFRQMTGAGIATPIGHAYGEQGRYSLVAPVMEPGRVETAMAPVHLEARAILSAEEISPARGEPTGGACMLDVTGAGRMDLVLTGEGSRPIRVFDPGPGRALREIDAGAAGLTGSGRAIACAVGDYDGDGLNDLAVAFEDRVALYRNLGKGRFQDVTAEAGLAGRNRPTGITFVDFDHDGDLDLMLTGSPAPRSAPAAGTPNVLWRNNGDRTFTEWTGPTGLGGSGETSALILTDFNNDRAVDLAVTGSGSPVLYANPREGRYPAQPLYGDAGLAPTRGIAALDFNRDGWMDIAVTHAGAPGLTLWRNLPGAGSGRRFERVALPAEGATAGWGVTAVDIDNDGWIDLAAIVETAAGPRVRVLRNRGDGGFEDVSRALGLDRVALTAPRGLIAADVDGDGAPDLIVTQFHAPPLLLTNLGAGGNHSVRLDLTGVADNRTALGAKVEVFASGLWQKFELAGSAGYQTGAPPRLLVGLGRAEGIDLLRILWPTGVLQDEIDLPGSGVIAMKEADRRGSSCPVLFAWDGQRYRLVTDVIGAAVVGHWFGPGQRNIPDPGEWVKVAGEALQPVDGRLSVRFMEPMEEVNYLDQLRLVAVDHPESVEVNPEERFLDSPPFASGRVVASAGTRLPLGAWDGEGRDVLDRLRRRDHLFAAGFTPLSYDGFAGLHALTLDLGPVDTRAPLRLLMTGYVNYFSATSLYAAWQGGVRPIAPYVEAERPDGSWQTIPGEAGFPAGLERTIVVDLSGRLPAGTRRIRLMTNLQIYWDQVLIDNHPEASFRTTETPLVLATERFRGYPAQIEGASPGDLDFDYDRISLTGPYQYPRGAYTRYGDVTALVTSVDDRYAIFGSGEEIAAEFDASGLPPLPPHWRRDYLFYANGFVKDMDWWEASPFTVAELPFHGMSSYPYPAGESLPGSGDALHYQLEWNDRFDTGEPVRAYRFSWREAHSTPGDDRPAAAGSGQVRE